MKLELSRPSFGKFSNITLHENSSSGNRDGQTDRQTVVLCGRSERWTDRRTDITKLIVKVFLKLIGEIRNFVKAPKRKPAIFCGVIVCILCV